MLRGGPLQGVYRLRQLHFHWGSSDDHGSEHVVNGVRYAGEVSVTTFSFKVGYKVIFLIIIWRGRGKNYDLSVFQAGLTLFICDVFFFHGFL